MQEFLKAFVVAALVTLPAWACPAQSQSLQPAPEARKLTVCELSKDPHAYNRQLIEVTGFISHGFEDFSLQDPECPSWPWVWLEYGGTVRSGTMYCCGVTADRSRPKELEVEKIAIPLVDDELFRKFDELVQRPPDSLVHARIVGRFFSGRKMQYPAGTFWGGYGHMGCCSLLAIERVLSVDSQDRKDLDHRAWADQPNIEDVGCGYRDLLPLEPYAGAMQAQRAADTGSDEWPFDDPQRVATQSLAALLKISASSIPDLKPKTQAQGRAVYEWKRKDASYMVVVSRPYWLSFYAKDPKRVAWVTIAAYESSCGKGNGVTRLR
jgi:hypothetical protein